MSLVRDFEHLQVQLKDIMLATNNFGDDPIGNGGFGKVYKGELSFPEGRRTVAIKRLDRQMGQGDNEFWKEIMMLSQCKHKNLISLLRFCREGDERILVYEYASNRSLDNHLGDTNLTWTQRLKICLGAAHGLNYLHDPLKTQQRVLHRDIKSSNILLDENFTVKVSDFGLSKIGPANQQYTYLVSNVVGTPGYCDPLYWETGVLSKESDVYSFGVVLFEVMCGKLCFEKCNGGLRILVAIWRKCYQDERLDDIIPKFMKEQAHFDSLKTFAGIANKCLNSDYQERPKMAEIIKNLEVALDIQEIYEDPEERIKSEERVRIANQAAQPISYRTRNELLSCLSKGILLKGDTRRVSINENCEYSEEISAKECVLYYPSLSRVKLCNSNVSEARYNSRFSKSARLSFSSSFQMEVHTKFLSPGVAYSINLVYSTGFVNSRFHVPFIYKLEGEAEYSTPRVECCYKNTNTVELYHFRSYQKEHNFKIHFKKPYCFSYSLTGPHQFKDDKLYIDSIEFRPLNYAKKENLDNENKADMQLATIESDHDWEQKLPSDYAEIIKWSKDNLLETSKKELYYLFRKGFLINNTSEKWVSIGKDMKKRYMLPATRILPQELRWKYLRRTKRWIWKSIPESRFDVVAESSNTKGFDLFCEVEPQLLSLETTYKGFLVYKLPEQKSMSRAIVRSHCTSTWHDLRTSYLCVLTLPYTPIVRLAVDEESPIQMRTRGVKGHPKLRKDGWMEIQLLKFHTRDFDTNRNTRILHCSLKTYQEWNFAGMLVQGLEFKPAKA